jgi:hypothetical protein
MVLRSTGWASLLTATPAPAHRQSVWLSPSLPLTLLLLLLLLCLAVPMAVLLVSAYRTPPREVCAACVVSTTWWSTQPRGSAVSGGGGSSLQYSVHWGTAVLHGKLTPLRESHAVAAHPRCWFSFQLPRRMKGVSDRTYRCRHRLPVRVCPGL